MAENKTQTTKASVTDFVEAIPDETRRADAKALLKLMRAATGEKPKMWGPSIIGFGSYHYKYDSGREGDMPMVGFSPRKAATVFYGLGGSGDLLSKCWVNIPPARAAFTSRNSPMWIRRCWKRWWSKPSPPRARSNRIDQGSTIAAFRIQSSFGKFSCRNALPPLNRASCLPARMPPPDVSP